MEEVKNGLESLMAAYEQSAEREPRRSEEYKRHVDWAIERAKKYAEKLDRDYTDSWLSGSRTATIGLSTTIRRPTNQTYLSAVLIPSSHTTSS